MTDYSERDLRDAQCNLDQIRKTCALSREVGGRDCHHVIREAQFRIEHIKQRLDVQPRQAKRLNNLWHARPNLAPDELEEILRSALKDL